MTKIEINDIIFKNLQEFYFQITGNVRSLHQSKLVSDNKFTWPNFLIHDNYKKLDENDLEIFGKEALKNNSLVIISEGGLPDDKNLLKKHKIIPVTLWQGMYLHTEKKIENKPIDCFTIEKVKTKSDLKNWFDIVNSGVLKNKTLSFKVFSRALKNKNYAFYIGKDEGEPVATIATLKSSNSTGLYFIATAKRFRGKGYGTKITKYAINKNIKKGETNFVLHATKLGEKIYKKIGFKEYFKIYLLKSLNIYNDGQQKDNKPNN